MYHVCKTNYPAFRRIYTNRMSFVPCTKTNLCSVISEQEGDRLREIDGLIDAHRQYVAHAVRFFLHVSESKGDFITFSLRNILKATLVSH